MRLLLHGWNGTYFQRFVGNIKYQEDITLTAFGDSYLNPEIANWEILNNIQKYAWESYMTMKIRGTKTLPSPSEDSIRVWEMLERREYFNLSRLFKRTIYATQSHYTLEAFSVYMIDFFFRILRKTKPDMILMPEVPHAFGDYCLIVAAKTMNINAICMRGALSGRALSRMYDPIKHKHVDTLKLHSENCKNEQEILNNLFDKIVKDGKTPYTKSYENHYRQDLKNAKREVMKSLGNRSDMVGLISKNKYRKERYNSKNLAELTKTKDKYIVLCLHYEPEANCCPYGGIYGDQLAFALKLNSICKKQNIKIMVREHPDQFGIPPSGFEPNKHWLCSDILHPRGKNIVDNQFESLEQFYGFCNKVKLKDIIDDDDCIGCASINGTVLLEFSCNNKIGISTEGFWGIDFDNIHDIKRIDRVEPKKTSREEFIKSGLKVLFYADFIEERPYYTYDNQVVNNEEAWQTSKKLAIFMKDICKKDITKVHA